LIIAGKGKLHTVPELICDGSDLSSLLKDKNISNSDVQYKKHSEEAACQQLPALIPLVFDISKESSQMILFIKNNNICLHGSLVTGPMLT
jgi:hypothetical protein